MNVGLELAVDGCKTQFALHPELYDGHPPIEEIVFHTRTRIVDPNLCAVSLAIVLQKYASESIIYQDAVQAHVAEAIESFFSTRRFRVAPIERTPVAIPRGTRRVLIGEVGSEGSSTTVFELGNSNSFTSSASLSRIHIASNLSHFFANQVAGHALASMAAATIFAADYSFGELRLVGNFTAQFNDEQFLRYQRLLGSVNLKLTRG